jgi:predicted CopG family antitoxin
MASTTITLNEPAYTRLKMLKRPGQSFSEVVLEYLHVPAETAGELLEYIESQPPAAGLNVERMEKALKHRKRRSRRDR